MRLYLAGALFTMAAGFQLKMIFVFRRMMDDVNERLPADARIPEIGLSLLRGRVIKLHRHYLPASGMRKELYFWWALEMVALLSALAMGVRFV